MSEIATLYDLEKIKKEVPLPRILSHYGIKPSRDGKISCILHNDTKTPNMHIYSDHAFCFSCRGVADIFSFVMRRERMNMEKAVEWVLKHQGILPETALLSAPREYKGPLPLEWVQHWAGMMDESRAQYLIDRGIQYDTILNNFIGYRPDKSAFVIPFWRGMPGASEADVVQYRINPTKSQSNRKFWGEEGHNKPSIINRHLINPKLVIILFGTIDALHAAQDGLPAISTNGAQAFSSTKRAESLWLKKELSNTKRIVIVPDNTASEFEAAYRLSVFLGAELAFFPFEGAKDYNDYRQSGKTAEEFCEEILKMPIKDLARGPEGTLWTVHQEHIERIGLILKELSNGRGQVAYGILQSIVRDDPDGYDRNHGLISWSLQRMCDLRFQGDSGVFNGKEWAAISDEFAQCVSYREIAGVIDRWSREAASRMGGF